MAAQDCIAKSKESEGFPAALRYLTVSYASRAPHYQRIPALCLKGQWLEAAGFTTGTEVEARIMHGCMVLTIRQPEPELKGLLHKVNKLSGRKRKQVQNLIDVAIEACN
jgi:toxic protein SymE